MSELNSIAKKIIKHGKGILAADESTTTMTKRLESVRIKSTFENRLRFRSLLFSSDAMQNYIGGVILFDETIRQKYEGLYIPKLIENNNSIPGIKVDIGAKRLAGSEEEKITEGLDGLRERLDEYYKLGARFTKWRGVYNISKRTPSQLAVYSNAHALARYASLAQEAGMVPIVEPELLMEGDHSADECLIKTTEVIKKCFDELIFNKVDLSGMILKPNMILPGKDSDQNLSSSEIAEMTLSCLMDSVPSEVPGIAFLSGGQSEIEATENLNNINRINKSSFVMTFSYGRALQQSSLKFWSKNINDEEGTKNIFNHRAKMCSLASKGEWNIDIETE